MMREILFRGKRADNGEWVYGYLTRRPSGMHLPGFATLWYIEVPPKNPDDNVNVYKVLPDTVGQYIGMEDTDGVKIFEGDIVRKYSSITNLEDIKQSGIQVTTGVVYWCKSGLDYEVTSGVCDYISVCLSNRSVLTVIGNIFDVSDEEATT